MRRSYSSASQLSPGFFKQAWNAVVAELVPLCSDVEPGIGVVHQTGYVRIEGHSQSLGVPQGSDDIVVTGQGVVVADRYSTGEPRGARKILIYLS